MSKERGRRSSGRCACGPLSIWRSEGKASKDFGAGSREEKLRRAIAQAKAGAKARGDQGLEVLKGRSARSRTARRSRAEHVVDCAQCRGALDQALGLRAKVGKAKVAARSSGKSSCRRARCTVRSVRVFLSS